MRELASSIVPNNVTIAAIHDTRLSAFIHTACAFPSIQASLPPILIPKLAVALQEALNYRCLQITNIH